MADDKESGVEVVVTVTDSSGGKGLVGPTLERINAAVQGANNAGHDVGEVVLVTENDGSNPSGSNH